MEKKFKKNDVVSQLRNAYGIRKVFSWARPWICPFDKFIFQVPENKSIFDVGCGNGVFLYLLAIFREPKKLYGIDVLPEELFSLEVRELDKWEYYCLFDTDYYKHRRAIYRKFYKWIFRFKYIFISVKYINFKRPAFIS